MNEDRKAKCRELIGFYNAFYVLNYQVIGQFKWNHAKINPVISHHVYDENTLQIS